ncbi:MAG: NAD-dependent epimerase/dehydratase family protein [candidate division WOR-3 bacterium]
MKGKVLVTGANGFIGSHLVEELITSGYEVRGLVRRTSNLEWLKGLPVDLCYGEVTDKSSLYWAVKDTDFILHTAGVTKAKDIKEYEKVNSQGTANLLAVCCEINSNLKRFVYFSSLAAAGPARNSQPKDETCECQPKSIYGLTKWKAEQLVLESSQQLPTVILRLPVVYGPRDRDGLFYFKLLKKRLRPVFGKAFSVIFIKDLVRAVKLCLEKPIKSGEIFFVSDGNCYSFDEIAKIAEELLGIRTLRFRVPEPILTLLALLLAKFLPNASIINPDKIKELTQPRWTCNIDKIKNELGFCPQFSLAEGLQLTVGWYKAQRWL